MFTSFLSSPSSLTSLATSATCYAVERSLDKVFALLGESDSQALDTGFEHIQRTVGNSSTPPQPVSASVGGVLPSSTSIEIRTGSASLDSSTPSTSLKLNLAPISTTAIHEDDEDLIGSCPPSPVSSISSFPPSPTFDTRSLFSIDEIDNEDDELEGEDEDDYEAWLERTPSFEVKLDFLEVYLDKRIDAERFPIALEQLDAAYSYVVGLVTGEDRWEQAYDAWMAEAREQGLPVEDVDTRCHHWISRISYALDGYSLYAAGLALLPSPLPLPPVPTLLNPPQPCTTYSSFTAFPLLPPRRSTCLTESADAARRTVELRQAARADPVLAAAQLGKGAPGASYVGRGHDSAKKDRHGATDCEKRCRASHAEASLRVFADSLAPTSRCSAAARSSPDLSRASSTPSVPSALSHAVPTPLPPSSFPPSPAALSLLSSTSSAIKPTAVSPLVAKRRITMRPSTRYGARWCRACTLDSPAEGALKKVLGVEILATPPAPRMSLSFSSRWLM
ncbi:hypothetical protein JCM8097_004258 [Rhodosporidiobolus ruineniae]